MSFCNICNKELNTNSPNYIINTNCECEFHFNCFEKYNKNYSNITLPKCTKCNKLYNKNKLAHYKNIVYDDAFNCWIEQTKNSYAICKEKNCYKLSKNIYLNYCKNHFEQINKEEIIKNLSIIFNQYIGLLPNKKFDIYVSLFQ